MKIIIVGMGKIGSAIAYQLVNEGHDVTAVDIQSEKLFKVSEDMDISCVKGSGADSDILSEAGVENTEIVIAVTANDEINLLCCLVAKKMGAAYTICRVRNPEYSDSVELIKDDLGLSLVVNPEREAALEMERIIENPFAKNVESFMDGKVKLFSFSLSADSPLCGSSVQQISAKTKTESLFCAVERGNEIYIPFGSFVFEENDTVTAIAFASGMHKLLAELGISRTKIKNVIIVGGGTTALYLAKQLLKRKTAVSIIEKNIKRAEFVSLEIPEADVINADGTEHTVLEEEGLSEADAICFLTGIDEENIISSLYARNLNPKIKTITKINRAELERMVKSLGIGSVVSLKQMSANLVLQYVRAKQNSIGSSVRTLYKLLDDKLEALEFVVNENSRLIDIPFKDLRLRENILIACINRGGELIMPNGSDVLKSGDTVIIVTTVSGLNELDEIGR